MRLTIFIHLLVVLFLALAGLIVHREIGLAEIRAANRGKVVFASYLGIYGNTVILDHGQGIASLYSHLSSIDTAVGAEA